MCTTQKPSLGTRLQWQWAPSPTEASMIRIRPPEWIPQPAIFHLHLSWGSTPEINVGQRKEVGKPC